MSDLIQDTVRSKYGAVARSGLSTEQAGVRSVAEAFGYSAEELAAIPAEANMGLSCGNPTALANLKPGEVVVDLGSGGGLDVFLAARKVGPTGRAIGIDMTEEMIALARKNASAARDAHGQPLRNVAFHLAKIDTIPLPDASVDCVISNCVINLAPDKPAVFREIARILKPGGRLAASDIALKRPLPPEVAGDLLAYVGCVAGAISFEAYRQGLASAGFSEVEIADTNADLNAYAEIEGGTSCCAVPVHEQTPNLEVVSTGCCSSAAHEVAEPAAGSAACCSTGAHDTPVREIAGASCCSSGTSDLHREIGALFTKYNINDYAASVKVFALKSPR